MKHKFKLIDCAEWSDTYKCVRCGATTTYAAEDCTSIEVIEECSGECPVTCGCGCDSGCCGDSH